MADAQGRGSCALPVIRGLNRVQAAAYIGVSPSLFDQMVSDGRMPKAKAINTRMVWDRLAVDRAFDLLPGGDASPDNDEWSPEV
jgi:hypothetical protein